MALPKVILFGDSLTQYCFGYEGCWGTLLADRLQRKCDVLNRGYAGYNTRWNKLIVENIFKPLLGHGDIVSVVILLGANDSNNSDNVVQHVPIEEYKQNLSDIIQSLINIGVSKNCIILIGTPRCDVSQWEDACKVKEVASILN